MLKKRTFTPRKWTLKVCFQKKGRVFSIKTAMYVRRLFEKFRYDEMFGRSAVMEVIDLKKVQRVKASLQISAGGYYRAVSVTEKENINSRSDDQIESSKNMDVPR